MDPLEGCLEIGLEFVFEFHISVRSPTNRGSLSPSFFKIIMIIILSVTIHNISMFSTHVDDHPLAVVVVVGHGVEVVGAGVLGVLVDALLLLAGDLGQ